MKLLGKKSQKENHQDLRIGRGIILKGKTDKLNFIKKLKYIDL